MCELPRNAGWAARGGRPVPAARTAGTARTAVLVLLAAPGARLPAATLVEDLLEALEVALDLAVVEAERAADLLLQALRLPAHLDRDLGLAGLRRPERHLARVGLAVDRAPGDPLVRHLVGDLGVPFVRAAAEAGDPMQAPVVELLDALDALHEARELLELRPLVVDRVDVVVEDLLLGDRGHATPFGCSPPVLTASPAGDSPPGQECDWCVLARSRRCAMGPDLVQAARRKPVGAGSGGSGLEGSSGAGVSSL